MRLEDRDVLLVGSVPLASAEDVFQACGRSLGEMLVSLPDGETGERTIWVVFQAYRIFHEHPQLETVRMPDAKEGKPDWAPSGLEDLWQFRIADGAGDVEFDDLLYADVAAESYATFTRLRSAGKIPEGTRFQVSLPMPDSGCSWFFGDPEDLARIVPAYERALLREIEKVAAAIQAHDLSLQFDVCWEVLVNDGLFAEVPGDHFQRFLDVVGAVSGRVPADALLGLHLCYADLGHQHFKEPDDLALCVRMANAAAEQARRPIDFLHMPVPRGRTDDAYFAPLADLDAGATKLFLGLVHDTDGVDGTLRRLEVAKRHLDRFGIATECGFGRRPPERVEPLLAVHREVAGHLG